MPWVTALPYSATMALAALCHDGLGSIERGEPLLVQGSLLVRGDSIGARGFY